MSTVYLPFIGQNALPVCDPNPRGFGIGIRSQNYATPRQRVHELLHPPCWHDWSSFWPGPGGYPCIWNPRVGPPGGISVAWAEHVPSDNPGQWWFVGNEPLDSHERSHSWIAPSVMAAQAIEFTDVTGENYVLCGERPDEAGLAYCQHLLKLGANPVAWHWHIYEHYASDWLKMVERVKRFDPVRQHFITETNARGRNEDGQRELMDIIMRALDDDPQLHAVFWYVTYAPDCPQAECLLTHDGPDCQITTTGRHYLAVTG